MGTETSKLDVVGWGMRKPALLIVTLFLTSTIVVSFQNCSRGFEATSLDDATSSAGFVLSASSKADQGVLGLLIDSRSYGYGYTYGPSMMTMPNGQTFVYACSSGTGDNDWDWIRITSTGDFRSAEGATTLIRPRAEGSACDPSVVQANDGYYYMFYGGLIHNIQTLMFVARSTTPWGPFERYSQDGHWRVDSATAQPVVGPFHATPDKDGRQDFYGAGAPSVVYKDGNFYMWYVDDTRDYPNKNQGIFLRTSVDAINWTAPIETNAKYGDVKWDPNTQTWVNFALEDEFTPRARVVVRFSKDAVRFTEPIEVCAAGSCLGYGANNIGAASDVHGFLMSHDVKLGYGANYDLNACDIYAPGADCWGRWNLYASGFSIADAISRYQGDIIGNVDGFTGDTLVGWACAQGLNQSIDVHVYVGGPAGEGANVRIARADLASDAGVTARCADQGAGHRFAIDMTDLKDAHGGKAIYVHGISPNGRANLLIQGSGRHFLARVEGAGAPDGGGGNPGTPAPLGDGVVIGSIDGVAGDNIVGWACMRGHNTPIDVHLYVGGGAGTGFFVRAARADHPSDAGVTAACGDGGGAHRFAIPAGDLREVFGDQKVHVHGISAIGGDNRQLNQSGVYGLPADQRDIIGAIEGVNNESIWGWACMKSVTAPIAVHLFVGGGLGVGQYARTTTAEIASEPAVRDACGGGDAHRFSIPIGDLITPYGGRSIYLLGVSPFSAKIANLPGSGGLFIPGEPMGEIYRFYKPWTGEHFFTGSYEEGVQGGYWSEGVAFRVLLNGAAPNTRPLMRCNRPNRGDQPSHFVSNDRNCEGQIVEGYYGAVYDVQYPGSFPIYRVVNPGNGDYLVSFDPNEGAGAGYQLEGLLGYTR